jgi:3-dehydroquinate synthase
MRGIAYVQLPTTLLAQVDSSIGGKTAVDLPAGKNLAGAFTQPSLVLTDTSVLPTLSEDDWRSGLAEIAKTAVLAGEEQLSWLEGTADALVRREPGPVSYAVCMCVRFKAAVVSSDEREAGGRECLNLGHTLGHAIENVAGYGVVPHGVAVAEGMRFSVGLAESLGARPAWSKRVGRLLDSLDLEAQDLRLDPRALRRAMSADKKSRGGHVRFVLASAPGVWECSIVDEDLLTEHLAIWVRGDLPETRG